MSVLNLRDYSNYLTPTAQTEQEWAQLTHEMVTDVHVLQQGNGKLRSPDTG